MTGIEAAQVLIRFIVIFMYSAPWKINIGSISDTFLDDQVKDAVRDWCLQTGRQFFQHYISQLVYR